MKWALKNTMRSDVFCTISSETCVALLLKRGTL
jgi:hypothetical protein